MLKRLRSGDKIDREFFNEIVAAVTARMSAPSGVFVHSGLHPGVEPVPRETLQRVRLKLVSGNPGSATTPCTFRYQFYDIDDVGYDSPLGDPAGVIPYEPRTAIGAYIAAPDGSYGLAFYDTSTDLTQGEWVLLRAFKERPDTATCLPP